MPDRDTNADLAGYHFVNHLDGGSAWYVKDTDPVLGAGYVLLFRQDTPGISPHDRRVQTAASIRRRKQIEEEK
jgi:hypothetical protein